jgi:hypothetical protein
MRAQTHTRPGHDHVHVHGTLLNHERLQFELFIAVLFG